MGGLALAPCSIGYDWLYRGIRTGTILDGELLVECLAERWSRRCGIENLIERWRTECFQLEEPSWQGVSVYPCPAIGVGRSHSDSFGDPLEYRCAFCKARPFWPVHTCLPEFRSFFAEVAEPSAEMRAEVAERCKHLRAWGREQWPHHCSPWDEVWPLSAYGIWHCWEGEP